MFRTSLLENLSKNNRWVRQADALYYKYIEKEYNKHPSAYNCGAGNKMRPLYAKYQAND